MNSKEMRSFEIINQANLDTKCIHCGKCKHRLTKPILLYDTEWNYCKFCDISLSADKKTAPKAKIRNRSLEASLATYKYPCKFDGCDAIETSDTIDDHQKTCKYATITCVYCITNKTYLNQSEMVAHLMDKHADITKKFIIDEPFANIELPTPITADNVYIIDIKGNTFIIFVKYKDNKFFFSVGKQLISSLPHDAFELKYWQNNTEKKIFRNITSNFYWCFVGLKKGTSLQFKNAELLAGEQHKIQIAFNNYKPDLLNECPICMNPLTMEVYQCVNGHNVCSKCAPKMNDCAMCRISSTSTKVNIREFLSNLVSACPNSGCLHYLKTFDDAHKSKCLFKKIACVSCKESYAKSSLLEHMALKHGCLPNLSNFSISVKNNTIGESINFIEFNNEIFRCSRIVYDFADEQMLCYSVCLMYNDDENEADKYRYEVHILDKDMSNIAVHKFGSHCQPASKVAYTSGVRLKLSKKFIVTSGNEHKFYYRYCIYVANK